MILRKHDLASGVEVCSRKSAHSVRVYMARCSSNGEFIVTLGGGGTEKFFKVWKTGNLELIQQVEGHDSPVNCVAISPTSKTIASGDEMVKIWEKGSEGIWECKKTWEDDFSGVVAVVFSPDNKMLATGGYSQIIKVYDVASDYSILHEFKGDIMAIWCLSFSPDSTRLCSAS